MQYRYIMLAIAMLLVCVGCVSALTISSSSSSSTVSTGNGESQSMTLTNGYSISTGLDENVLDLNENLLEEDIEIASITPIDDLEEGDMVALNDTEEKSSKNCAEVSKAELIVRFEPEYFEFSDGTLNVLAMAEAELKAHSAISATVLSDLTEIGMPGLQLVQLSDDMSLEEGIAYYGSLPGVRFAEPNYQISIYSDECEEDDSIDILAETSDSDI